MINLGSLLSRRFLFLVPFLLPLGWSQIVSGGLSRAFLCRTIFSCCLFSRSLPILLVNIINSFEVLFIIFVSFRISLSLALFFRSIGLCLVVGFIISWCSLTSGCILDAHVFTELIVTDLTISVVIASPQDCLLVVSPREERVFLQVIDQVWH